jgi:hypothetical protein
VADLARRPALKLRVFIRRTRLDEELAEGIDPGSRPALALRAIQLVRPRYRRRLAGSVERIVADFDADRGFWLSAAVPFLRDQVAEARGTLLALANALRTAERVHPRGVALVSRLLLDPASSPLYVRSARGALQLKAQAALDCLLSERQAREEAWVASSAWKGGSGVRR